MIAGGPLAGVSFAEYWKQKHTEDFPILVKLIDAAEPLSVQVHPGDAYAARLGEHGKTGMWLILDAGSDSCQRIPGLTQLPEIVGCLS